MSLDGVQMYVGSGHHPCATFGTPARYTGAKDGRGSVGDVVSDAQNVLRIPNRTLRAVYIYTIMIVNYP